MCSVKLFKDTQRGINNDSGVFVCVQDPEVPCGKEEV